MVNWVLASYYRRRATYVYLQLQTRSAGKCCTASSPSREPADRDLGGDRSVGGQFGPKAPLQFLAQLGYFHPGHNDELAAKHFPGLVVVRQLAGNSAILAVLVPTKSPIGNCFRANELKTPEKRVALRHLKLLAHHGDLHELLIGAKGFRHN